MYGYRQRIGLILPSTNTVMESELNIMKPEGVSIHATRVHLTATNPEGLREMAQNAQRAVLELKTCLCDVIIYACTSGSFVNGIDWEEDFRQELSHLAGVPVLTATYACRLALDKYAKKKIALATPYIKPLNDAAVRYFSEAGYDIVSQHGLGIETSTNIGKNPPYVVYQLGKTAYSQEAELLFISCTGMRTIESIEMLERDLGVPVISSNISCLWAALNSHGLYDSLKGYGSLLANRQ